MFVRTDSVSGTAVDVKTTLPEPFRTVKEACACSVWVTALSTSAETVTVCPASAKEELGVTLTTDTRFCREAGPTLTVAWSVVLSGTSASGVSSTVSVAVWPMASVIGAALNPVSVKPESVLKVSAALAATLPTFSRVTVAVAGSPGTVDTWTGLLAIVTASIAGMVNDSVTVCVMAGLVVLVAVTWNESGVPGAGRTEPATGTR